MHAATTIEPAKPVCAEGVSCRLRPFRFGWRDAERRQAFGQRADGAGTARTASTAVLLSSAAAGLMTCRAGRAASGSRVAALAAADCTGPPAFQQLGRPGQSFGAQEGDGKTAGPAAPPHLSMRRWSSGDPAAANVERDRPEAQLEQPVAAGRLRVVIALGRGAGDDLDLARVEAEALVDGARPAARRRGRWAGRCASGSFRSAPARCEDRSMSARDWVANTTATFFLRSVFSHSRMRAANSGSSRNSQASSRTSRVGRPSKRASRRWNR